MADVIMDFNGVRKRVPADRVAYFQEKKGGKVVQPTAPAAPEPSMWERAREGVKSAGRAVMDFNQSNIDAGTAALRGASLGFDDEIAALTARAGGLVQRQRDSDDMVGMGGGESVLESWRATAPLGDEARQERRAEVEAAKKRSPLVAPLSEAGAMIATSMAAPGAQGGRLAQFLSNVASGAAAGVGMGDAEDPDDAEADAIIGGGIGALPGAAGVAGRGGKAVYRAARGVLRPRGVPSAPKTAAPAAAPLRERAAGLLDEVATEGPLGALRKRAASGAAEMLRGPKPPPAPTRTPYEQALDDALARMDDPATLKAANEALKAPAKVLDEPMLLITPKSKPPAPKPATESLVPDVEDFGPAQVRETVQEIQQRFVAVPPPPAPARGTAGEVLTDLRRSTLGRQPTQAEIRDAIEEVAVREGITDIASLSSKIGVPTTKMRDILVPMLRDSQFRARVAAGGAGAKSSALSEADQMGRTIRDAQQAARSPIDNVSGRPARQVAAVQQQERWRSAYDALPPEQRAAFIQQIRQESGLPDDVIRRRLKMTMAEWRRTSFERSKAANP